MQAAVRTFGDPECANLVATLTVNGQPTTAPASAATTTLASISTCLSADGNAVVFTFPSLQSLGKAIRNPDRITVTLQVGTAGHRELSPVGQPLACLYTPVAGVPTFEMEVEGKKEIVATSDGEAQVRLVFPRLDPRADIVFKIRGATLKTIDPLFSPAFVDALGHLHMSKGHVITLELQGIALGSTVVIGARDERTSFACKPISLRVRSQADLTGAGSGYTGTATPQFQGATAPVQTGTSISPAGQNPATNPSQPVIMRPSGD